MEDVECGMIRAECPICFGNYGHNAESIPRMIQCGHSYCSSCLEKFISSNNKIIACPRCRAKLPLEKVRDLHNRADIVRANFIENYDLIPIQQLAHRTHQDNMLKTHTLKTKSSQDAKHEDDFQVSKPRPYANFKLEKEVHITDADMIQKLDYFWEQITPENPLQQILYTGEVLFALFGQPVNRILAFGDLESSFPEMIKVLPVERQHQTKAQRSRARSKRQKTIPDSMTHYFSMAIPGAQTVKCFTVGSNGRFYVRLSNGATFQHASPEFLEDIHPIFMSPTEENPDPAARIEYHPKFVAFGPQWESYLITYENGMSSWSNLPNSLDTALIRKEKKNIFINELCIGADWSWYGQFSDFSHEVKDTDKSLEKAFSVIESNVGVVKHVTFLGDDSTQFIVLYQKPNFPSRA